MNVMAIKNGRKWSLVDSKGTVLFTGKSRVSCFNWAYEHGMYIMSYQHGGK